MGCTEHNRRCEPADKCECERQGCAAGCLPVFLVALGVLLFFCLLGSPALL